MRSLNSSIFVGARSLLFVVVSLLLFVPGVFEVPPIDRDEPRFAQSSKQMIETGDYVDIRLQEDTRYKKPVGVYWAQSVLVGWLANPPFNEIGWYRLVSVISMIGCVLLTGYIFSILVASKIAWRASAIMGMFLLSGVEARLAKSDAFLLFFILMAMVPVAQLFMQRSVNRILFYGGLGAGVLVKGPVIFIPVLGSLGIDVRMAAECALVVSSLDLVGNSYVRLHNRSLVFGNRHPKSWPVFR